jgi:hypothetical protein
MKRSLKVAVLSVLIVSFFACAAMLWSNPNPVQASSSSTNVANAVNSAAQTGATSADGRTITFVNNTSQTVWAGSQGNPGFSAPDSGGWAMPPGSTHSVVVPVNWGGRFWGRTYCSFDGSGKGTCETGDCGGVLQCNGAGGVIPATLAEFTLGSVANNGDDFYDVSYVDGFNIPMTITPVGGASSSERPGDSYWCGVAGCGTDLNPDCPSVLQVVDASGRIVACQSACGKFGTDAYCCPNGSIYGSAATCKASVYAAYFRSKCSLAYSYAFDDAKSTFSDKDANYQITFGPASPVSATPTPTPTPTQTPAQLPECDPSQVVTDQCTIYIDNVDVDAVSCTPSASNTAFIAFNCIDDYAQSGSFNPGGGQSAEPSYTISCKIPTSDILQKVQVSCTDTDKQLSGAVCVYNSYKDMSICVNTNANALCFAQTLTPDSSDPITGLPILPTPAANGKAAVPPVCAVQVSSCPGPSTGQQPAPTDLLLGASDGLLVSTSPADTYASSVTYQFWLITAGLALALLAIPFALAGYQIMLGFSSVNRASSIQLLSRIALLAVAVGVSYWALSALIDLENGMVGSLYTSFKSIPPSTFMPSSGWQCNVHQFFGDVFNLTVYTSQKTNKQISIDQFSAYTNNATATLIGNLPNYVMTLLAILLFIQLFVRLALLNLHIIVSPLAIVCGALPEQFGATAIWHWIKGFASLLFVQILQLTVIWLGVNLVPATLLSGSSWLNEVLAKVIPISFLVIALHIPKLFNTPVTTMLTTITSSIGNAMTGVILIIRGF